MNETLKLIENRKSVRAYIDKDITQDFKDKIIFSAMRAPTAGNMMLYTIIEKTGIALDELCINAFNHGNKKDTRKAVTVKASIDCCDIKFTITDEGKGFSPNSVIDPVSNIGEIMNRSVEEEYTHGRGIRISMNFFDFLEYNETGNSVTVEKKKIPNKIRWS